MSEVILLSFFLNGLYSVGGFIMLILALRALDLLSGFNMREWLRNEKTDPRALAFYLGCRVIAGAIVIAGVVSLPV